MPYRDKNKEQYSNYWFSTTFAPNQWMFNKLVTPITVDKLEQDGGVCILYTHLGYYMKNGKIDQGFIEKIKYISQKNNGWFVPVSTVLDFLIKNKTSDIVIPRIVKLKMELLYLFVRFKYRRILKIDDYIFKKSNEYLN